MSWPLSAAWYRVWASFPASFFFFFFFYVRVFVCVCDVLHWGILTACVCTCMSCVAMCMYNLCECCRTCCDLCCVCACVCAFTKVDILGGRWTMVFSQASWREGGGQLLKTGSCADKPTFPPFFYIFCIRRVPFATFMKKGRGTDSSRPMQDIGVPRCFSFFFFSLSLVTHCGQSFHSLQWTRHAQPVVDLSQGPFPHFFFSAPPVPSQYSSLVDHGTTHSFLLQSTGRHLTQRRRSRERTQLHAAFFFSSPLGLLHSSQLACLLQCHSSWNKSFKKFSARNWDPLATLRVQFIDPVLGGSLYSLLHDFTRKGSSSAAAVPVPHWVRDLKSCSCLQTVRACL